MINKQPDLKGLSVLIMEHSLSSLQNMKKDLEGFGADVFAFEKPEAAYATLSKKHLHVVMASLDFADEHFIEAIKKYKNDFPETFVYLLTEEDYDSVETSLEDVRLIVDDYIQKPMDAVRFARMIETNIGRPSTGSTSLAVIEPLVAKVKPYFIFRSSAMRRALSRLPEIASSGQTVLISGETGTGKELVARAIHALSPLSSGPFVPINCGAIPESLIEGELFGHEKGAFTGALKTRKGKFESAHNGTLFLDEIGDMPLNLQVRLLRVLEDGMVYRVGGERPIHVKARVIAATAADLAKLVKDRLFREDLYYRLNILRIHLPPLRERVEDVPLLCLHFLERAFSEMGRIPPYPSLSSETIYLLEKLPWKGNVRELRNIMTRIATLLPPDTKRIFPIHILPLIEEPGKVFMASEKENSGTIIPSGSTLDQAEELLIQKALEQTNGNRTQAARLLGISLRTLRRKLNKNRQ